MSMRTEEAAATANGLHKKDMANGHGNGMTAEESEALKDTFEHHEPVGPPIYGEKKLDCSDGILSLDTSQNPCLIYSC